MNSQKGMEMASRVANEDKGRLWLYENKYKETDKHPLKTGTGAIPKALAHEIVKRFKEDPTLDEVPLRTAAWERVSKKGNPYIFVSMEVEDPKDAAEEVPF